MPTDPTPSDLTIACHVRPTLVLAPVDAKIDTLRRCEADGTIDSLVLRSWPDEVVRTDETPHAAVLEQYDRFRHWADRADVSLAPAFRTRHRTSMVEDHAVECLVTPSICLACYEDGELLGVVPHTDGDTTHTVPETIATLRTGSLPAALHGRPRVPVAAREEVDRASAGTGYSASLARTSSLAGACPDCEALLVNVQGLEDCPNCGSARTETATPRVQRH